MQHVLNYLQTHHDQRISLNQLAKVAGYSPYHFQRLCQQKLGLGPGKLNELIRLQRGYFLLSYRLPTLLLTVVMSPRTVSAARLNG